MLAGTHGYLWCMSHETDKLKGRTKEAAGDLTGNDELKREGKVDQASGNIKEKAEHAIEGVADKARDILGRNKDGN